MPSHVVPAGIAVVPVFPFLLCGVLWMPHLAVTWCSFFLLPHAVVAVTVHSSKREKEKEFVRKRLQEDEENRKCLPCFFCTEFVLTAQVPGVSDVGGAGVTVVGLSLCTARKRSKKDTHQLSFVESMQVEGMEDEKRNGTMDLSTYSVSVWRPIHSNAELSLVCARGNTSPKTCSCIHSAELKLYCTKHGLPVRGKKPDLVRRVQEHTLD